MKDLDEIIRREPLISKVISVSDGVFVVGGYIRDLLRGSRSKDIDFVAAGDIKELISGVFPDMGVTVVEFKRALTLRVVTGDYILDFSELKGSLDEDLALRDFTMNAIAWSVKTGLVDPLNGAGDIAAGHIRGISEKNFEDDPLRLLRAYRFAGELGWEIDRETRKLVRKLRHLIRLSASERITFEIIRLLNSVHYFNALKMAPGDGLLNEILIFKKSKLEANVKALSQFNSYLKKIHEGHNISFNEYLSQGLTYTGLLRGEQLLYGTNMEANYLRFSRVIFNRVVTMERLLEQYGKTRNMSKSRLFDIFEEAGDAVLDFALLSRKPSYLDEAERFLSTKAVLTGQEVMELTGLGSGPELGSMLRELKKLQFIGKIRDKSDAARWLGRRT